MPFICMHKCNNNHNNNNNNNNNNKASASSGPSPHDTANSVVIFGATGYLALNVIYPNLWQLYRNQQLPPNTRIYGFARTKLHTAFFRIKCSQSFEWDKESESDMKKYRAFWAMCEYIQGQYDNIADYVNLAKILSSNESKHNMSAANRIFYIALPPIVFDTITLNISRKLMSKKGWNRVIIEKPFARNEQTYKLYQTALCSTFKESEIYLIDHYLSKEVIQNFLTFRFANAIFNDTWDRNHIKAIMISVKDELGVKTNLDYFDKYGIIRDVMQNHMMQILAFLTMEQPLSGNIEDIRDEKLKLLKAITTIDISDVIVGQYVNNHSSTNANNVGYTEEVDVPPDSFTPTYAMVVVHIQNKRWNSVPIILRCGKGLNNKKTEVRVQYKTVKCDFFEGVSKCNELVIRMHPAEDIFMRLMVKRAGNKYVLDEQEFHLTSKQFRSHYHTEPYQRLLLEVFAGSQMMFMRSDEICESWRIFSPVLHRMERDKIKPLSYPLGSRGPQMAFNRAYREGFIFHNLDIHK